MPSEEEKTWKAVAEKSRQVGYLVGLICGLRHCVTPEIREQIDDGLRHYRDNYGGDVTPFEIPEANGGD